MRRMGGVVVALLILGMLGHVVVAREHILLSVDYGRSTVIRQAGQAITELMGEMKQGNLTAAGQHFASVGSLLESLGMDLARQTPLIREEAFEVLGIVLMDFQDSLIANEALWKNDPRLQGFVSGELAKIGNIAGPIIFAGLQDGEQEVQLRSFLAIGVLLGWRVDFRDLSVSASYQDLSILSMDHLTQINRQLELLKEYDKSSPQLAKWIEVLSAISDKVHEMIEAAAE